MPFILPKLNFVLCMTTLFWSWETHYDTLHPKSLIKDRVITSHLLPQAPNCVGLISFLLSLYLDCAGYLVQNGSHVFYKQAGETMSQKLCTLAMDLWTDK